MTHFDSRVYTARMSPDLEFVLASESPRRKLLLEEAGFRITVFPVKVSELLEKNLNVQAQIQAISGQKWKAAKTDWTRTKGVPALLLTADTMVVLDGQALGKPRDSDEAERVLASLSAREHEVITAVSLGLSSSSKPVEEICTTRVFFRPISRQEIQDYVRTGEPMDKAGSYGIQGLAGKFVEKIDGPFDNVVGLPVDLVRKLAQNNGWNLPRR